MEDGMSSIYFSSYKADKAWNFEEMVSTIDPIWKNTFFFLYTWTGCDTTPAIYGHGKTFLISKISSSQELHRYAELVN